ncbi:MAG: DUF1353 domain-containing protein [Gammaproteobacteria bacterium]|nr:MAG: DUF1353 domain-containing protein [Gammaproteobacteria bacterium]
MPFRTELELKPYGYKWRTVSHLVYETIAGDYVVVPPNFKTDLASIPRLLRLICPMHGPYTRAAVVHDYLYSTKEIDDTPIERKRADRIFYEAMRESGVRRTKAYLMYLAVRAGGWFPWKT